MYRKRDGSGHVFAAQISEVRPFHMPGSQTLLFSNSNKRVNLIPAWVRANNPQVGGYFVVEDDAHANTICRYVAGVEFDALFEAAS